jgi:hypothetical protein
MRRLPPQRLENHHLERPRKKIAIGSVRHRPSHYRPRVNRYEEVLSRGIFTTSQSRRLLIRMNSFANPRTMPRTDQNPDSRQCGTFVAAWPRSARSRERFLTESIQGPIKRSKSIHQSRGINFAENRISAVLHKGGYHISPFRDPK